MVVRPYTNLIDNNDKPNQNRRHPRNNDTESNGAATESASISNINAPPVKSLAQCSKEPLECFLMGNIQGLYPKSNRNKVPFLSDLAHKEDLAFLALTESHPSEKVNDVEIQLQNYTVFRTDRKDRSHGGTITYVRNDLASNTETLLSYSSGQAEVLLLHIKKLADRHKHLSASTLQ
ncbi:hypothetical protein GWK47_034003 [Chionoecetes opilio]|uniref:Uncharacterized protein n=1 Tax=Chionoecetes opilio TaxID=41210 RepID=A0A8J4YV26_CHIOP|nr:hypothetical protein GWK47_034003 [Chionoecetes opilio]